MSDEANLQTCLWGDFEISAADLFSRGDGARLDHGKGLLHIVHSQGDIAFTPHFVHREDRIALDQKGLVLLGNLSEFGLDAERLLHGAGYPARFEVTPTDSGFTIVDRQEDATAPPVATAEEHVGLIFRGQTQDLPGRPTLLFAGTSPLGILAATRWATQSGLTNIPAPPAFPNSPIEALVRLLHPEPSLPALSDLETVRLICGSAAYVRHEWKEAVRRTLIQVLRVRGEAKVIFVGDHRIEVSASDLSQLLLLLIERSEKEKWTTIAQALGRLDGKTLPGRDRTLMARKSDIARLSPDPNFLQTMLLMPEGKPAYRLRADIVFIESNVVPA